MGAFNILKYQGRCPRCGQEADMDIQIRAAASFESDEYGRFHQRIYRIGDQLQWWPMTDPLHDEWHDHRYIVRVDENRYKETAYIGCPSCKAYLVCTVTYVDMRIENVEDLRLSGPIKHTPADRVLDHLWNDTRAAVSLDCNTLIAAIENDKIDRVLAAIRGRQVTITPQAIREFEIGTNRMWRTEPAQISSLTKFMALVDARRSPMPKFDQELDVLNAAMMRGKLMSEEDALITASAQLANKATIITNDKDFIKALNAVKYPNQRF